MNPVATPDDQVIHLWVSRAGSPEHVPVRECGLCGALVSTDKWPRHEAHHQRERSLRRADGNGR